MFWRGQALLLDILHKVVIEIATIKTDSAQPKLGKGFTKNNDKRGIT